MRESNKISLVIEYMLNIFELVKNNVILKGISPLKKHYNRYVFVPYVPETNTYDYSLKFPRQVYSRNMEWNPDLKNGWVDIMGNRQGKTKNTHLESGDTKQHQAMWKDLGDIRKIREFILVIDDIDLWRNCLMYYGITEEILIGMDMGKKGHNFRKIWYKSYCSLDIYLPDYRMAIELDSGYHNAVIDKARDRYFEKRYGIKTERFYEYHLHPDQRTRLGNILKYGKESSSYTPDQTDTLVIGYIKENKSASSLLKRLLGFGYEPTDIYKMGISDFKKYSLEPVIAETINTVKEICTP